MQTRKEISCISPFYISKEWKCVHATASSFIYHMDWNLYLAHFATKIVKYSHNMHGTCIWMFRILQFEGEFTICPRLLCTCKMYSVNEKFAQTFVHQYKTEQLSKLKCIRKPLVCTCKMDSVDCYSILRAQAVFWPPCCTEAKNRITHKMKRIASSIRLSVNAL